MARKKFINDPQALVQELLEGYALAYKDQVRLTPPNLIVRAKQKDRGKVGIVTLGGSGHEPGLVGFVGEGMLDVAVPGQIFAAPNPKRVLEAIIRAEQGAGVLLLVLNHPGDVIVANKAILLANAEGINVKMLLIHDDITGEAPNEPESRRGLVGFLPVAKVAGAASEQGFELSQVVKAASEIHDEVRTLAITSQPATHPITNAPLFFLEEDKISVGAGQHGEPGVELRDMMQADDVADFVAEQLFSNLQLGRGDKILLIVNGSGATTLMELFIINRRLNAFFQERGVVVVRNLVGEYITTQEQAGFQTMIGRMNDHLLALWDAPCISPYFVQTERDR